MSALKGAEDLKNLVNRFKGIIEAGEYLQGLGDLQQAEQEAKNSRDAAKLQAEEERAKLSSLQFQIIEAENSIKKSQKDAEEIIARANIQASGIICEANDKASAIQDEAKRRTEQFIREGNGHKTTLEKIQKQVEEETKKLKDVMDEIERAKNRISSL